MELGYDGLDSFDSGQEPVAGSCEHGNKASGSMKREVEGSVH